MSCLDVMYQVYGPPPQPYFTAAYSPYHHQKLAFYSKMQEAHESTSSFSNVPGAAPIKEEQDCGRDKEPPPQGEYLSSRCVLFTYFQGDISAVVDEHFSRALSHPSGGQQQASSGTAGNKSTRDGAFPMNQRSFPPSFWNSTFQPSVPTTLGNALSSPHTELPFPGDPYSSASLHNHLHQPSPDAWHPSHHHHHHHHHPYSLGSAISSQGSAYSRPGVHEVYGTAFDPRYGSLLVPSVRPHHRLAPGSSVPGPSGSPCDIGGKGESAAGSAWSGAFTGAGSEIGLNMDTDNEIDGRTVLQMTEGMKMEDQVKFLSALEQLKHAKQAPVTQTAPVAVVLPMLNCKVQLPQAVVTALTNEDTDLRSHGKNRLKNMLIQALYDHLSHETMYPSHKQYVELLQSVLYNFPYLKESYGTGFEALHESLKNKFKKERKPQLNVEEINKMRKKYSTPYRGRKRPPDSRRWEIRKKKA